MMKRRLLLSVIVSGCAALVGCSAASSESSSAYSGADRGAESGGGGGAGGGGSMAAPSGGGAPAPASDPKGTPGGQAQAGQLTSGVWDDNLNFDFFQKYLASTKGLESVPFWSAGEREAAHQAAMAQADAKTDLDVTLLLDTTGSMGDELAYLQTEFDAIATTIHDKFPQASARFGLVLYKDQGDAYVTRKFELTSDVATFRANLQQQTHGGGGDYPEAVEEGLSQAVSLKWRTGSTARLVFWVADAPHHPGREDAVRQAIDGALAKGIHVYPVAASGTDDRTEYTMRSAAQITGGRYLFLTDDSGIGNDHVEPHIPCYHVTRFDGAIVRMVESEMTGKHIAPSPDQIVRTVGNPVDGKCVRKDGPVVIY
jgi:hypothetical protein